MRAAHLLPPKLATTLLKHLSSNDALCGDLRESYAAGKSAGWYWRQVLTVIGTEMFRMVRPSLSWSVAATIGVLVLLEGPFLLRGPAPSDGIAWLLVVLYLAPQALIIAVPVGLTLGMLVAPRSQGQQPALLALIGAVIVAVATFLVVGWLVPASNQAYRVTVGGPGVHRGDAELTILELHSLMSGAGGWDVAVNYYARFAVSCAPIAFAILGMWAARLGHVAHRVVVVATVGLYLAYVFVAPSAFRSIPPIPPVVVGWMPVVTVIGAAALSRVLSRRLTTN